MPVMIKTKPLLINLLLTLVAVFLHGYLTQKFFDLQNGLASGQSLCNLSSVWNCDVVSTSKYARFAGFPLALWALVTHLVYLVVQSGVLIRQELRDTWATLVAILTLGIAAASVVMASISMTQLKTFCLFCFIAYGLSITNFVFLKLAGFEFKTAFAGLGQASRDKLTWGALLAIPVMTFVLAKNWGGPVTDSRMQTRIQDAVASWQAAPSANFELGSGLRLGADPAQAKMTLVEFADFRCPHCKHAAPTLKAFVLSRPDVALIFKPYPLDGTCNAAPVFKGQGDGISCRLAFAMQCSEKLDQKGWEMSSHIFDNQEEYLQLRNLELVDSKLCESGLVKDCEAFKVCMSADETRLSIQKMAEEGTQAGIRGTPAFFLNGKSLSGGQFLPILEEAERTLKAQSN